MNAGGPARGAARSARSPASPALRIALLGAESTGKTALARELPARLAALTGLRCTFVPEHLRHWCDAMGRTPRRDEQAAIASSQQKAIEAAAATHDLVVCDTTPLMTAVYSRLVFDDPSLDAAAVAWHRRCQATLLMATDLPWVADGLQRDGEHVRAPVDAMLRSLLQQHGLPWAEVSGTGAQRLACAVDALAPLLRPRQRQAGALFTGRAGGAPGPRWRCLDCGDPACAPGRHALGPR